MSAPHPSDGPLSHARSAYWLGKIAEAQGRAAQAATHYKDAARFTELRLVESSDGGGELDLFRVKILRCQLR